MSVAIGWLVAMRSFLPLSFGLVGVLAAVNAAAGPSALIAASDPAAVSELELSRVAASPSPLWLRARVAAHAKLALVTGADRTDHAVNASAWLGAVDFATRVRVSPPAGPLAACSQVTGNLADSGAPEPGVIDPSSVVTLGSEVELLRALSDANLVVSADEIAALTANVAAPYRFALFESGENVADTATLRLQLASPALTVPGVVVASRAAVPATVIALGPAELEPDVANRFDPTDFAVSYSGADAHTNYTTARGAWLAEDPTRWLVEARGSSPLFDYTVIAGAGQLEPGVSQYFERVLGVQPGRACFGSVLAARTRGSHSDADFACNGADDLKLAEMALNFGDLRVTRLFGSLGAQELALRVSTAPIRDSSLVATDFDGTNCKPASASSTPGRTGSMSGSSSSGTGQGSYYGGSVSDDGSASVDSTVDSSDEGCGVTVYPESCAGDTSTSSSDSSSDSCSGDSSSSDSSSDSCSGDSSSSDDSANDSCSGNSSSSDSSNDSCSGDSSSSDDDSSGCGSSGYKGDTCSGSTESSATVEQTSSALTASGQKKQTRPRRLHLSLITLLAAALALPLRRRGARLFTQL